MCCFSRPVKFVGATKIFARFLNAVDQCLVYEMKIDADEYLAMILPIPVTQPAKDDAVSFIDLSKYTDFFQDIDLAFPKPQSAPLSYGLSNQSATARAASAPLVVKRVGSFDASFVPSIRDFGRLDAQFRLDNAVWKSLPQYASYGFAVFKLRKGSQHVHPMAFRFPSATPGKLFFPTVHIHDGKVHKEEEFDHTLYAQAWQNAVIKGVDWQESPTNAGQFVDAKRDKGLVWAGGHIYKKSIFGKAKNADVIAEARRMG
jgi:hypothetical protein